MEFFLIAGAVGAWAAIHSWLASARIKARVRERLGDASMRLYRLSYNVLSALTFAPLWLLVRALPDQVLYRISPPWAYVLTGGQAVSAMLLVLAALQTNALHFVGLAQLVGSRAVPAIVTTGFYRIVRHPIYLLGLLVMWLTPVLSMNQLALYLVLTIYVFVGASLEERRLLQEFGATYDDYRSRTPMVIPGWRAARRTMGQSAQD